ncbi:MAG: hypothetical protein NW214_10275 [Pseudanabaenaceae cyanobacterium bins.39]|nr:hypothetical protein [Pseudanabaenaceae cyanobacterium bins.39]
MSTSTNIKFTIAFIDADLDDEEKDSDARKLLAQLKRLDEIETVNRVLDPNPPEGNKSTGGFLAGLLTAEVNPSNIKKFGEFLYQRLSSKPIELEVEANGRKLKVKANSQADLVVAIEAVQKFIQV